MEMIGNAICVTLWSAVLASIPAAFYYGNEALKDKIVVLSDRINVDRRAVGDLKTNHSGTERALRNWSILCFVSGALSSICKAKSEEIAIQICAFIGLGVVSVFAFINAVSSCRRMNKIEDDIKSKEALTTLDQLDRRGKVESVWFDGEFVKKHSQPIWTG